MAKFIDWLLVISSIYYVASASSVISEETLISIMGRLESLEKQVLQNQKSERATDVYRTCYETRLSNPSLTSGTYYIDPDGINTGDNPISVYCDMPTGSTIINHDSESKYDVGHCADPGCYFKNVTYSASMRQMTELARLSGECHQSIKYDCNYAPFEINGIAYGWWNDRYGVARYFWTGPFSSVHTCQCGVDRTCVDPSTKCNCDALAPVNLADDGVITEKNLLPITRLNFGRTQLSSSSGAHTLGRFICSGQFILDEAPTSCADLSLIGNTLRGFYSVKGKTTQQVETVYCNFMKAPTDSGYETRIGFSDVKSSPTYFSVIRTVNTTTAMILGTIVDFQVEQLNIGGAMNLASGKFTAPRNGTYYFAFSGVAKFLSTGGSLQIQLATNYGRNLGNTYFIGGSSSYNLYSSGSIEVTAHLTAGEQVYLTVASVSYAYLYQNPNSNDFNQFTGWLLNEDLSP